MTGTEGGGDAAVLIDFLVVHPLLGIAVMLLGGYVLGRLAGALHLPEITGFVLAGLIMGGDVLGIVGDNAANELVVITEVALGIIAFTIGSELRAPKLRRMGETVGWITASQFVLTLALVTAALTATSMAWPIAALLGVIATTTSPAAVVHVVQETRARGRFVDTLFGTVALGDALSIAMFGIFLALTPALLGGEIAIAGLLMDAISELSVSVVFGVFVGTFIFLTTRRQSNSGEILILTLGFLFLSTAGSVAAGLSPLLTNMVAGATLANLSSANVRIFRSLEPLTPPVYALFFVLAGTKLSPAILGQTETLVFGGLFIAARAIGKIAGSALGATAAGQPPALRRWLGLGLMPHAGVALGLVLLLQAAPAFELIPDFQPETITTLVNIILMSVFVNEITGPVFAVFAIRRANQLED